MNTTNILFLCPHNAAKSVAAAAFAARDAAAAGIEIAAKTAGTEPDSEVLPIVRARLEADGLAVEDSPRLVTSNDLAEADIIVNIGCDHADLETASVIEDWAVPNFSDDPDAAFASLREHVATLIQRLSAEAI